MSILNSFLPGQMHAALKVGVKVAQESSLVIKGAVHASRNLQIQAKA
jgi:hypothetical protein